MKKTSYENLVINSRKNVITMMVKNGKEIEEIQSKIDQLDELIPDKELMEFLNNAGIENCERCGKLERRDCMRSHGNEDYSDLLCADCHGEQY